MPNTLASNPEEGLWESLPDHILLSVLQYLKAKDLLLATQVCKQWSRVGTDEFLWKDLFYSRWGVDREIHLAPGRTSWLSEYKRLLYHIPHYETEDLQEHRDQVLHVSFSHSGQYFATSSKDGFVKVWTTSYPCRVKYFEDMKAYTWKYTQYTQFNTSDTLLLVSGVHFGSHSTSGEIAVFNLTDGFTLQCRVQNKPYDIFGTWYNQSHLLSGSLTWLGNFSSCSILWLNKASQELDSEWQNVVMKLFRFLNTNASSIRTIFVSNCPVEKKPAQGSCSSIEDTPTEYQQAQDSDNGKTTSDKKSSSHRKRKVCDTQLSRHNSRARPAEEVKRICSESDDTHGNNGQSSEMCNHQRLHVETTGESSEKRDSQCSENSGPSECSLSSSSSSEEEIKVTGSVTLAEGQTSMELLSTETGGLQLGESHDATQQQQGNNINSTSADNEDNSYQTLAQKNFKLHEEHKTEREAATESSVDWFQEDTPAFQKVCDATSSSSEEERDKYLIFTTGSMTYTPHQIGIKRIKHGDTIGRLDKLSRERWVREQKLKLQHQLKVEKSLKKEAHSGPDSPAESPAQSDSSDTEANGDVEEGPANMDPVDNLIEMNGHIIGMQLSPDHRYLYVNTRAWPHNYQIEDPLEPPPIAQQIEIHVVDLLTIQDLGVMHCAHKAYTPNDECFFIFLDVCNEYVASGAEDKFGYLWDRHYRVLLNKYPHNDVVNSVAFHPGDSEVMVTVSDDFKVKVWRSRNRCRELGIDTSELLSYEKVGGSTALGATTTSQSVENAPQPNAPLPDAPQPDAQQPDAPQLDVQQPDAPQLDAQQPNAEVHFVMGEVEGAVQDNV